MGKRFSITVAVAVAATVAAVSLALATPSAVAAESAGDIYAQLNAKGRDLKAKLAADSTVKVIWPAR